MGRSARIKVGVHDCLCTMSKPQHSFPPFARPNSWGTYEYKEIKFKTLRPILPILGTAQFLHYKHGGFWAHA